MACFKPFSSIYSSGTIMTFLENVFREVSADENIGLTGPKFGCVVEK